MKVWTWFWQGYDTNTMDVIDRHWHRTDTKHQQVFSPFMKIFKKWVQVIISRYFLVNMEWKIFCDDIMFPLFCFSGCPIWISFAQYGICRICSWQLLSSCKKIRQSFFSFIIPQQASPGKFIHFFYTFQDISFQNCGLWN